jgi:hypothetical protein
MRAVALFVDVVVVVVVDVVVVVHRRISRF